MQHLKVLLTLVLAAASVSCSVISREIRAEAEPRADFGALLENPDAFRGRTVFRGGYIRDVRVDGDRSLLRGLQARLSLRDEPAVRSDSQGRFCLVQRGFLEPEIFRPGRKITVAGRVMGMAAAPQGPCLTLEAREIHLWQVNPYRDLPYDYFDEWDYPFFIRRRLHGYDDR